MRHFSFKFFMVNGKEQTRECHVTTVLRLQFTFALQEELPAVIISDLRRGFLALKIVHALLRQ